MMLFATRSMYLTCKEVATKEGLSRQAVARMCRLEILFPAVKHGNTWMIDPTYSIAMVGGKPGRPRNPNPKAKHARRGRPKGVKNSRPYPKGVKRPRKKASE